MIKRIGMLTSGGDCQGIECYHAGRGKGINQFHR